MTVRSISRVIPVSLRPIHVYVVALLLAPVRYTLSAQASPLRAADTALFAPLPSPGHVVAETTYTSSGVTRWTLSNGLVVFLKPTTSTYDEIQFIGLSNGGLASLADTDFPTAAALPAIIQASGIGPYSEEQLNQRLSGKYVEMQVEQTKHRTLIEGKTKREDLPTAFQLMYLKMTAPRYDSIAAAKMIEANIRRTRYRRPASVGTDSAELARYGHVRFWFAPPDSSTLAQFDPRAAVGLYRSLFADPHEMAFSFTGPFTAKEIRPFVERYLGSLPVIPRQSGGTTIHSAAPGIMRRTFHLLGLQHGWEIVDFSGPFGDDAKSQAILNILHGVLSRRLGMALGANQVRIGGKQQDLNPNEDNVATFSVNVLNADDPARRRMIDSTIIAAVDSLQRHGLTSEEVEDVVQRLGGDRIVSDSGPDWIDFAQDYLAHQPVGLKHDQVVLHRADISALVQQAKNVCDLHHYAVFTLLPAATSGSDDLGGTSP